MHPMIDVRECTHEAMCGLSEYIQLAVPTIHKMHKPYPLALHHTFHTQEPKRNKLRQCCSIWSFFQSIQSMKTIVTTSLSSWTLGRMKKANESRVLVESTRLASTPLPERVGHNQHPSLLAKCFEERTLVTRNKRTRLEVALIVRISFDGVTRVWFTLWRVSFFLFLCVLVACPRLVWLCVSAVYVWSSFFYFFWDDNSHSRAKFEGDVMSEFTTAKFTVEVLQGIQVGSESVAILTLFVIIFL